MSIEVYHHNVQPEFIHLHIVLGMKKTPLTHLHRNSGARMVEYADYEMPVEYTGVTQEHLAVRNGAGIFDVSHMGEFWVKGPGALDLLQYITTNNVASLAIGQAQYSCFPNGQGGIVDDLIVYRYDTKKYMLRILIRIGTGLTGIIHLALFLRTLPIKWH